jgi:hypothetical protein
MLNELKPRDVEEVQERGSSKKKAVPVTGRGGR